MAALTLGPVTSAAASERTVPAAGAGRDVEDYIAQRQRAWIFRWNKTPEDPPFSFDRTFANYYDFVSDDVAFYDDLAPDHQVATSASQYGDFFEPLFNALSRAEHAIEVEPTVVASGHIAASRMIFVARFTAPNGVISGIRTNSSLVWRHSQRRDRRGWRIVQEHNSSVALTRQQVDGLFATLPTR